MPYPVQNLIEGHGEPVCVQSGDSAQKALGLMVEHDFSQLPIIDDSRRPIGMITHESILRAFSNFGANVEKLLVDDAVIKAPIYRLEDDLFELLDRLRDTNAVLIVDGEQKLTGIVTSYDSTEYFRRRAEDMMLVEDIETMLKDLILSAHIDSNGNTDWSKLRTAIDNITSSSQELKKKYAKAVLEYLKQVEHAESEVNPSALEYSYNQMVSKEKPKEFDQLTLGEYIALMLHPKQWEFYEPILKIEQQAFQKLMDGVRETRNALAHFRSEITAAQRDQLRFCTEWLTHHQNPIALNLTDSVRIDKALQIVVEDQVSNKDSVAIYQGEGDATQVIIPTEEEFGASESRYAPLAIWLQSRPGNIDRVQLSFEEIESIIDSDLPTSARRHRAWWANDPTSHSHSQQWLNAGWRSSFVNLAEERVTFARIAEREKAYIRFFGELIAELREKVKFHVKDISPGGQNWVVVSSLPEKGPQLSVFVCAFTRSRRFRVELYIDTGDKVANKSVFDELNNQKASIETALGESLAWERIDDKRACRIALYCEGAIDGSKSKLTTLRSWAVEKMTIFYEVLIAPVSQALQKV